MIQSAGALMIGTAAQRPISLELMGFVERAFLLHDL